MSRPLFSLGRILATSGAISAVAPEAIRKALVRHVTGDWGELDAEDKAENDRSVGERLRILSAYVYEGSPRFWIITEADRSATTVLLPEEY